MNRGNTKKLFFMRNFERLYIYFSFLSLALLLRRLSLPCDPISHQAEIKYKRIDQSVSCLVFTLTKK